MSIRYGSSWIKEITSSPQARLYHACLKSAGIEVVADGDSGSIWSYIVQYHKFRTTLRGKGRFAPLHHSLDRPSSYQGRKESGQVDHGSGSTVDPGQCLCMTVAWLARSFNHEDLTVIATSHDLVDIHCDIWDVKVRDEIA